MYATWHVQFCTTGIYIVSDYIASGVLNFLIYLLPVWYKVKHFGQQVITMRATVLYTVYIFLIVKYY
jgi:hypothetical protein